MKGLKALDGLRSVPATPFVGMFLGSWVLTDSMGVEMRRKILNPGLNSYLHKTLVSLLASMPGVRIAEIGFDADHIHMVMNILPKYAIATVLGQLKSQSASKRRKLA